MEKLAKNSFEDANSQEAVFKFKSYSYFPTKKIYSSPNRATQPVWQIMMHSICKAGFNVDRIANNLHVSKTTVYKLMDGSTENPSNKTFYKLVNFYCAIFCLSNTKGKDTVVKH